MILYIRRLFHVLYGFLGLWRPMTSVAEGSGPLNANSDSDYDSDKIYENGRPESKRFICGVVEGESIFRYRSGDIYI